MSIFIKCLYGPRLYQIHKRGDVPGYPYRPNSLENIGDTVVKWMKFCWGASIWTSPAILLFLYRRGTFTAEGLTSATSYAIGVSIIVSIAIIIRGVGRVTNAEYRKFLTVLYEARRNFNTETKYKLCQYDSDLTHWPVDFIWNMASYGDGSKPEIYPKRSASHRSTADRFKALPCYILSYIAAHTFGRRMLYPGTTALIQTLIGPALMQGRAKLIDEKNGQRAKLVTVDNNDIDTMFVDCRNKPHHPNGNILVICSEGNSGYYEVGCMVTPLEAGYSVLGWNHPGFWGSTGVPWPASERAAIDCVMQYAIHKLGFQPENIVLFAWSIGGFPASWAAMTYPNIRHVVLDATFDSVLPLAMARMPPSWKSLVNLTVKKYLDLNNGEQLCKYPGPVLLIRRSKDEMITTVDPTVLASNRANDLVLMLLQHRYPKLVDSDTLSLMRSYLGASRLGQSELLSRFEVESMLCESEIASYVSEHSASFPMMLGEELEVPAKIRLALFLVSKHLLDFDSTHCTPLPANQFITPWQPPVDF